MKLSLARALLMVVLALALAACSRPFDSVPTPTSRQQLSITCPQPDATLWIDGLPGPALPCVVEIPPNGCRLRITHATLPARQCRLSPDRAATLGGRLDVDLGQVVATVSLQISSTPTDAEVRLDGVVRGRTPLALSGLRPGKHTLALSAAGRAPVEQGLNLLSTQPAKRIHLRLPNGLVAYYRTMVRREPGNLNHHAELAHQLVLQERDSEAIEAFVSGIRQLRTTPKANADRFWQEVQRTLAGQYRLGRVAQSDSFAKILGDRLAAICRAEVCDVPQVCISYARLLKVLGHTTEAREQTRAIKRKFRSNPALRRLMPK